MSSTNQLEEEDIATSQTRIEDPFDETMSNDSDLEREITVIEATVSLSLRDLLYETWNSGYAAPRNITLLFAFVSKYMFDHRKTDATVRRMHEGGELKAALLEIYSFWTHKGPTQCTRTQMLSFLRKNKDPTVYPLLTRAIMTRDTFNEWVKEYRSYVENLPGPSSSPRPEGSSDESARETRGIDALFDRTSERDANRISQYVTKLDNGRLLTARSPGEIGSQLIRLYLYDVKDIAKRDKRVWWKHARLRAQVLCSSARTDRKRRLLRQLLDEAADDLMKVPGVATEVMSVARDDDGGGM